MFPFVFSEQSAALSLRSGSSSLYTGGFKHRVVQVTVHPKYTKFSEDYDVAIIKVYFSSWLYVKSFSSCVLRYATFLRLLLNRRQSPSLRQVQNWIPAL
jgi:hypothetical protein